MASVITDHVTLMTSRMRSTSRLRAISVSDVAKQRLDIVKRDFVYTQFKYNVMQRI